MGHKVFFIIIIIHSLELGQLLNTWKNMTRVLFAPFICNKADKVFYIT